MSKLIIITTTSDSVDVLNNIADRLITDQLAACCQISQPIKSIYRWKNKVESSTEFELKIKTAGVIFDNVASIMKSLHNYDVPQIVAVNVTHVDEDYQQWAQTQLT